MKKNGPYKIIGSKKIYKNPWIKVREDKVIHPNGKDGIFGIVDMLPGISVVPIDSEGNTYLMDKYCYAIERNTFEVPTGGCDDGEEPLVSAKRELEEETGIIANEWIELGSVDPFTMVINSPAFIYLARDLSFTDVKPDGMAQEKPFKIEFEKAVQMVMDSKITHGPSCVAILKAEKYLKNNK